MFIFFSLFLSFNLNYTIVGKDILRFHAIYWPAFLMAADMQLPKKILCHGHWLVNNRKMSKSIGNVIDPFECLKKYTLDGMRYFLLREGLPDSDCSINQDKLTKFINSELANTLGNLYSRVIPFNNNFIYYSYKQIESYLDEDDKIFIKNLNNLRKECDTYYKDFYFYYGIQLIMTNLRNTNNFVQNYKPWNLKNSKNENDCNKLKKMLFLVYEALRISSILLQPIVPDLSNDLLDRLNVEHNERFYKNALVDIKSDTKSIKHKQNILFKRLL
jgi:methionyl-tRNA synthetase